jgi:hypothetical protein
MRKLVLTTALAALSSAALYAQTPRLALYEEFSGENCGPCAASNPAFWSLLSGGTNPSKVLLIKYQSPIPSAGPIYNAYTTVTRARLTYYSVPFAPYGRLDGTGLGTGTAALGSDGHIANLLQSDIDADAAVAPPFAITASHQWTANADSLRATVNLSALRAYAPAGANLKLRIALIEHLSYASAPGTNGETEFHNVVREMYPDAAGTQLANSWTLGQTQTITLKGRVPGYVDKAPAGETRIVVWVQNDTDKSIPQAAASTYTLLPVDVASNALVLPSTLACATGNTTVAPAVVLKNTGAAPITSARIYYKLDAGTWQTYNWTGSLASLATTSVTLPTLTVRPGTHSIADSVALPNNTVDVNKGNNKTSTSLFVYNTAGAALPLAADFENTGSLPANWLLFDANTNGRNWTVYRHPTASVGHGASTYMLYYNNYDFLSGETNYAILPAAILPTTGTRTLSFYQAHAQYQTLNDRLDVVYSTDCGTTWTSIWNLSGAALATANPTTSRYIPTQSQWVNRTVDVTAVPVGAMLAFRATSDYGNSLYIDDVTLSAAGVTAVSNVVAANATTLSPNPATNQAVLSFDLLKNTTVSVEVVDALGRIVATPTVGTSLNARTQRVAINTANLAVGLYSVVIRTGEGSLTKHLSVVH